VIPWETIDRAQIPGDKGALTLMKRGSEFSIRTQDTELMNSRRYGSEDALAVLTCRRLNRKSGLRILIGGLGMGYTLAAALGQTGPDARITVSELVPAVVRWNRQHLGHLAGMPLADSRVSVAEEDVGQTIRKKNPPGMPAFLMSTTVPKGLAGKPMIASTTGPV
jgi:spermidine synthase